MKRLILVDGNAILHRAYHALPDTLTLKDGTPVNAVYGFTSMLLKVIEDLKPTYLVCSFDLPKPTFRDELFADYRAQRPPTPDKLVRQVGMVKDVVRAFGIPIYEIEGYEADDVIGTLAAQAISKWEVGNGKWDIEVRGGIDDSGKSKSQKVTPQSAAGANHTSHITHHTSQIEIIIATGDRDLLQLVDDKVKVYMPVKGLSQTKMYGAKEVEEKYGIKPEQMVDYKALVGDPSDNYPGVKGIGPKTACDLINKYGTLEKIYRVVNDKKDIRSYAVVVQKKIAEALEKYKKDAFMAKKLAKIVTDVPVELDLGKAKVGRLDTLEVKQQFDELAFKTLWKRVKEIGRSCAADGFRNNDPHKQNTDQNDQLTML